MNLEKTLQNLTNQSKDEKKLRSVNMMLYIVEH